MKFIQQFLGDIDWNNIGAAPLRLQIGIIAGMSAVILAVGLLFDIKPQYDLLHLKKIEYKKFSSEKIIKNSIIENAQKIKKTQEIGKESQKTQSELAKDFLKALADFELDIVSYKKNTTKTQGVILGGYAKMEKFFYTVARQNNAAVFQKIRIKPVKEEVQVEFDVIFSDIYCNKTQKKEYVIAKRNPFAQDFVLGLQKIKPNGIIYAQGKSIEIYSDLHNGLEWSKGFGEVDVA